MAKNNTQSKKADEECKSECSSLRDCILLLIGKEGTGRPARQRQPLM